MKLPWWVIGLVVIAYFVNAYNIWREYTRKGYFIMAIDIALFIVLTWILIMTFRKEEEGMKDGTR